MPIKINHVRVFKGTHDTVVAEYYQILGFDPIKFGSSPKVKTIIECKIPELRQKLIEIKNQGITYKREEQFKQHDVWIPYDDRRKQDAKAN